MGEPGIALNTDSGIFVDSRTDEPPMSALLWNALASCNAIVFVLMEVDRSYLSCFDLII